VKVGDYIHTVGYLRYELNWIDDPNNRTILIGALAGGVGLIILLIVVGVIIIVCLRKKKRRQQQQRPISVRNVYEGKVRIKARLIYTGCPFPFPKKWQSFYAL